MGKKHITVGKRKSLKRHLPNFHQQHQQGKCQDKNGQGQENASNFAEQGYNVTQRTMQRTGAGAENVLQPGQNAGAALRRQAATAHR